MTGKTTKQKTPAFMEMYIELELTKPRIWRRFLIQDSLSMYQLHEIIQVTMGWMNCHLFMFRANGLVIAVPNPDDDWHTVECKDARKTKVSSIFKSPGDSICYEYDFGDSWEHELRFERFVKEDEVMFDVPRCIGGENACPPEDCGSIPGFERLKAIIADPKNEEYQSMIDWLDGYYPNYDPKEFSIGAVNKILKMGASNYLRLMPEFF